MSGADDFPDMGAMAVFLEGFFNNSDFWPPLDAEDADRIAWVRPERPFFSLSDFPDFSSIFPENFRDFNDFDEEPAIRPPLAIGWEPRLAIAQG